jgi:hypothetical protein
MGDKVHHSNQHVAEKALLLKRESIESLSKDRPFSGMLLLVT